MTGFRFPASLALFVLTAVDAQARPGMGGSYEAGSSGSTYSSPSSSSGASSSSSFSEPSFPTTPTPSPPVGSYTPPTPTADELRNAEYDALTASASLHALELSISPEGRFLVREVLDFHDPKSENKRGVRYAAPFHMPRYWWPVDAAVVPVGGFLSGTFGDDAAEKIPIQVESQRLIASRGPSPYAVAYFAWAAPNPDSQPAAPRPDQFVAEMELLPGSKFAKDGDHLALIYALPQCAECEDTTIALRLRSPGQRPNATWRVVGLDDASRPERTTMIAVDDDPSAPGTYVARIPTHQPSARGEATAVHALFIRADFPANTFPQAQDSAANRGEHEVVVHQDGTLSVVSSVNLAKPALNGELRPTIAIEPFSRTMNPLHPARQLHTALPYDIDRNATGPDTLAYQIVYSSIGQWTDDPEDATNLHSWLIFEPPSLDNALPTVETVRFRFDDSSWTAGLRVRVGEETPEDLLPLMPPIDESIVTQNGMIEVSFSQPPDGLPRPIFLHADRPNPTEVIPAYLTALVHHVQNSGPGDYLPAAEDALWQWAFLVLGPIVLGSVLVAPFAKPLLRRWRSSLARQRAIQDVKYRLSELDPAFRWPDFEARVRRGTTLLFQAWSDGQLENARHVVSSGVYQRFRIQCRLLADVDGIRNRLADFRVLDIHPERLDVENGYETLHLRIQAELRDVNVPVNADGVTTAKALAAAPVTTFEEIHAYTRRRGATTRPGTDPIERHDCPNCGARASFSHASVRCEHCDTEFNSGEADWVLTEITQAVEWNPEGSETGPALPEGMSRQILEDKAAALFWRALAGAATLRVPSTLSPYLADGAADDPEDLYGPAAGTHAIPVVGGLELRDLFERDGVRWALLDVRWSSRRVQPNPDTAPQNRPSVLTMALPCDETDLRSQRFSDASDCGTCGAPVTDRHEPTCPYCGATRTVHIADWRLFRIV